MKYAIAIFTVCVLIWLIIALSVLIRHKTRHIKPEDVAQQEKTKQALQQFLIELSKYLK